MSADIPGVEFHMSALADITDGAALHAALDPLVDAWRTWIDRQKEALSGSPHREVLDELFRRAEKAADRVAEGIEIVASDPDVLAAFQLANRVVGEALYRSALIEALAPSRKGDRVDPPPDSTGFAWRPFQLAFLLLNIPSLVDPHHPDRLTVDLLYFPTGGGKTEAYFGLAAFAMGLRRLRNRGPTGKEGAGVSVIMRYTLRLLTLDQLARASRLVCALELERQRDPQRWGAWPFEIGLWVGRGGTPNRMGRKNDKRSDTARAKVRAYKRDPRHAASPIPLESCPWCGERFQPESFHLLPDDDAPTDLRVSCLNRRCDFSRGRFLPVVAVDEPIYRRLPAFIIGTVDKFAALPWEGRAGVLLGGADRHGRDASDAEGFFGPAEPKGGVALDRPLPPPDLVIQDELHLISGPLGTMVGLYETAVEALARRGKVRPKLVASTATVRRADHQVQALYGRDDTRVFPPPGPSRADDFFAVLDREQPGRRYVGVAAPGRNAKVIMRRTALALMGAAQRQWKLAASSGASPNPADPYMTLLTYFGSLRDLGGARRIFEEEIQNTLKSIGRRFRLAPPHRFFTDRTRFNEVVELTSRVSTGEIAQARARLGRTFDAKDRVDVALATNMISVGLDIPRLGLMVVNGQPKSHAEYIQSTSRVGRRADAPGLVVTLYNLFKPRDRSHWERFRHYHETFYAWVEGSSVTPFSARALDRGLAGALVALARHRDPKLTPAYGAQHIKAVRSSLESQVKDVFHDRVDAHPLAVPADRAPLQQDVRGRIGKLFDAWEGITDHFTQLGEVLHYQPWEGDAKVHLLRDPLDDDLPVSKLRLFRVNRSLRDVEPAVQLRIVDFYSGENR